MPKFLTFEDADERAAGIRADKQRNRKALQRMSDAAALDRQKEAAESATALEELRQRGETGRKQAEIDADKILRDAQAEYYRKSADEKGLETDIGRKLLESEFPEGGSKPAGAPAKPESEDSLLERYYSPDYEATPEETTAVEEIRRRITQQDTEDFYGKIAEEQTPFRKFGRGIRDYFRGLAGMSSFTR